MGEVFKKTNYFNELLKKTIEKIPTAQKNIRKKTNKNTPYPTI